MLQNLALKGLVGLGKIIYKHRFHSHIAAINHNNMRIKLLPALQDNYMYLLIDEKTNEAAIVDPVEPEKVMAAVKEENVNLTTVLTTHHHWDHSGGNSDLHKLLQNLTFYGGDERIPELTQKLKHDDVIQVGSLSIRSLSTPCHTTGHLCYFVKDLSDSEQIPAVFTGDTLFVGGCGRFFEGKPEEMHAALNEILASLPDQTKVYCGHEYTVSNLKYALHVESSNQAIIDKLSWAKNQREQKLSTIPSTIGEEKTYNPFMRVSQPSVQSHAKQNDPIATMAFIRTEKDNFKAK